MKYILIFTSALVLLSCNSKVNEGVDVAAVAEAKKGCVGSNCAVCDLPWGGTLASGQSLDTVYSTNIVTCSEECSEKKVKVTCEEGVLKAESFAGLPIDLTLGLHQKCFKQRCDCNHNGTVIEDGKEVTFFRSNSVSCTANCESRKLKCRSGIVEDTLEPAKPQWALNFRESTCTKRACLNCNLPTGDSLIHGTTTPVHSMNTSTCTTSCTSNRINLTCNNGTITGGDTSVYKHVSCTPAVCATCTMPCGGTVGSGGSRFCYKRATPLSCGFTCLSERTRFLCDNGIVKTEDGVVATNEVKAANSFSSCNEGAACSSCKLPDGRSVLDSIKVTFFKETTVACGQQCFSSTNAVSLTCSNGTFANKNLYPDFLHTSCEANCTTGTNGDNGVGNVPGEGGGAPRYMCQLPWRGGIVTHKTRITAFSRMSVPAGEKCSTYKRVIECIGQRGLWTGGGAYIYPTCVEE